MLPALDISGAVATITLRRPESANRLAPDDLAAIAGHLATVDADPDVLVLTFRGQGRHFCGGFDVHQLADPISDDGGRAESAFERLVDAVEQARPVTIAVLHGGVYGGATDLALACDFRVGSARAEMFMPAVRLGLHYYRSGLERYVARLGLDTAKRLFLTAEKLDADAMFACGFLTQRVAPAKLDETVDTLVATLASMAPLAMLGMKKNLNRIAAGTLDPEELRRDIARTVASEDLREGAAAWIEKRAPRFRGR